MRALRIEVFKSHFGDCSNGGITSKYNELLVICPDGNVEVDDNNPPENLVKIVEKDYGFMVYKHLEPVKKSDHIGWMAGGCVGYTSDSRFRRMSEYPLVIHDRQETQREYDLYSS